MKILGIILGVMVVVGGVFCMLTPILTFASLGWVIGAVMVAEGIANIFTWSSRKNAGFADGWTLAGAILSTVLGLAIVCSGFLQFAVDDILAYLVAFWLIAGGFARIFAAFSLRGMYKDGAPVGKNWGLILLAGICVVVMGFICLFHPLLTMASAGFLVGLGIVSAGCSLIAASLSMSA